MRQKLEQTTLRLFLYDFWDYFSDVTFFLISAHDILLIILKFAFFLTEKSLLWSYMGPMTLMQKLEFLHGYWWFKKKKKSLLRLTFFTVCLHFIHPQPQLSQVPTKALQILWVWNHLSLPQSTFDILGSEMRLNFWWVPCVTTVVLFRIYI